MKTATRRESYVAKRQARRRARALRALEAEAAWLLGQARALLGAAADVFEIVGDTDGVRHMAKVRKLVRAVQRLLARPGSLVPFPGTRDQAWHLVHNIGIHSKLMEGVIWEAIDDQKVPLPPRHTRGEWGKQLIEVAEVAEALLNRAGAAPPPLTDEDWQDPWAHDWRAVALYEALRKNIIQLDLDPEDAVPLTFAQHVAATAPPPPPPSRATRRYLRAIKRS